jgi:filamentous hemagglutinin
VVAELSGGSGLAGATGGLTGELGASAIAQALYGTTDSSRLTSVQKENLSALATLASGIVSGVSSGSASGAVTGGLAGKNAVENNALSSQDEKQRQDAKWSLPYLEGEKKQQAETLISDLNAKDKAFDAAMDTACKNLSSAACQGMRQELAAMGRSYDEQLDGQYIGNMGSIYKEGKGQVDALMWQYATADATAGREANVNRIAENWGVSKETADNLYTAMAGVHTTAAVGGAFYGLKGVKEPSVSPAKPVNKTPAFDANEIRFSQNTVSNNKTERGTGVKYTYGDLVSSMKKDGWKGGPVDVIKMPDGKMTSMDNTRISAAREAGIKVESNVRSYDEKLTPSEIERFQTESVVLCLKHGVRQ